MHRISNNEITKLKINVITHIANSIANKEDTNIFTTTLTTSMSVLVYYASKKKAVSRIIVKNF